MVGKASSFLTHPNNSQGDPNESKEIVSTTTEGTEYTEKDCSHFRVFGDFRG
ncbi:MAG: hypothetical protein ACJASX_001746 [Limisphaerales bacterium]|jgi:hypothetical protein